MASWRLALFTGPAIPVATIGLPIAVYLPPYYSGTLGLSLSTVGLIFFLVRAFDLPMDLFFGFAVDRTRTRLGQFRPWFVVGAAIILAAAGLVFMAQPGIGALRAFAGLMLIYVGMSIYSLSHTAWAATLSAGYDERSRIFGWIQAMSVFGLVVTLTIPPIAAWAFGARSTAAGIHAMGWFLILILPFSMMAVLATTAETPPVVRDRPSGIGDFVAPLRSALMRRLLAADLFAGLAPGVTGAMFIFYFEHRLNFGAAAASGLLLIYFVAGLGAAPLWMRLAYRIGKHRAAASAGVLFCVTSVAIVLVPPGDYVVAAIGMAIAGSPYAAYPFLMRAMLADVLDVDRLDSGEDRTALFTATLVTTQKFAHALPIAFIYPALDLVGFDPAPGAANDPTAMLGMTTMFIVMPALLMMVAVWAMLRWPLDQASHAEVRAALEAQAESAHGS